MTQASKGYFKIGLTGGIGSGKTTAANRFRELGAHVYHADAVSRGALDTGAVCYDRVINAFGKAILRADGSIDRKMLGEIVFTDEKKRDLLNSIIHPYVIETLFALAKQDCKADPNAIAVFEVPLLFESGMNEKMDRNVVVISQQESRIQRVMQRDSLTREQVLARMSAQMPEEEKLLLADDILVNDGSEEELIAQVDALYETLKAGGTRA